MKTIALKSLFLLLSLFSVFVFAGGSWHTFGRSLIKEKCRGDLYHIVQIRDFNAELPCPQAPESLHNPSSSLIFIGDSFFHEKATGPTLMAMISGAFSLPGHNLSYFASSENIYDLVKNNLDKQHSQPRVLLLGFAERFITHHYKRGMFALDKTSSSTELKGWELFKYNLTFFDDPWDHDRFDFFFKRNIFVQPLFEAFQTYRYHLTGDLGSESVAPFVWKDTNMLFINGDWIFYREEHSNELIKQIAGSIAALADRLRSEFGIELTFIIFPNKFSIYGDKVYSKFIYDGFIPKITHELKSRGVATFDTYSAILPFRENPLLYVPTDTHLSLEGKELIVAKLKEEMKKRDLTPTAEQPLSRD